ncbi:MAG: Co2+/Mg2+ efflux protein ApaG [Neomegalonema sp.]|nr:Co2+/Mg2+ efflux protein ApaG [Neomegalonema sp.]
MANNDDHSRDDADAPRATSSSAAIATYRLETDGVLVEVTPNFVEGQSDPDGDRYLWTYAIRIVNNRETSVRLLRRYWRLADRDGRIDEVRGDGVIGQQPTIAPGQSFEYASAAPLRAPSGLMGGHFEMISANGDDIIIPTPTFSLDSPYDTPILH